MDSIQAAMTNRDITVQNMLLVNTAHFEMLESYRKNSNPKTFFFLPVKKRVVTVL